MSGVSVLREEGVPERGALRRWAGPNSTWPTRSANLSEHTVSPRSSGRVEICGDAVLEDRAKGRCLACKTPSRAPPPPARGAHLQQQHGGGARAQRGLQQPRELRIAEGHVRSARSQRGHHASQCQQRAVDGPGLPQTLGAVRVSSRRADRPRLPGTLGSSQVHQVQRACRGERTHVEGAPSLPCGEAPRRAGRRPSYLRCLNRAEGTPRAASV